jgi:stress response protein YsnF
MFERVTMKRIIAARGAPVYDAEGKQIGAVDVVFCDRNTGEPEWVAIGTGFLGRRRVLVPLHSARLTCEGLHVPYSKDHVKDSPDIDSDEISEATERELHSFYQLRTATPAGRRGKAARKGQQGVTRAEEELKVGKRRVEAGKVSLRKWVETEPVDVDVELQRETARVRREQIDQPARDAELGEGEVEVLLRAEDRVAKSRRHKNAGL